MSRYHGRHRPGTVTPVPYEEALSQHVNAVDRNGKRYTTHSSAGRSDWWWGATILTPSCIEWLRRDGLLPLTEVTA